MSNQNKLLTTGEHGSEGIDPRKIPLEEWPEDTERSPIKAIRKKCLDCSGGNDAEVRKCVITDCPLYPFRMGKNVFHSRASQK